jgi:hypothetical protein
MDVLAYDTFLLKVTLPFTKGLKKYENKNKQVKK